MVTKKAKKKGAAEKRGAKKTYVGLVLDETGSMTACRDAAIEAFNEQIATLQKHDKKGGRTLASLWCFSENGGGEERVRERHFNVAPKELRPISRETYVPDGTTPLFDAIGEAISKLEKFDEKGDVGFLLVIVSDGQENASREWTNEAISERVKALEATGRWTFAYIGANWNLNDVHRHLGINKGNIAAYQPTAAGTKAMGTHVSTSTAHYLTARGRGSTASLDFWGAGDATDLDSLPDSDLLPKPQPPSLGPEWDDPKVRKALTKR